MADGLSRNGNGQHDIWCVEVPLAGGQKIALRNNAAGEALVAFHDDQTGPFSYTTGTPADPAHIILFKRIAELEILLTETAYLLNKERGVSNAGGIQSSQNEVHENMREAIAAAIRQVKPNWKLPRGYSDADINNEVRNLLRLANAVGVYDTHRLTTDYHKMLDAYNEWTGEDGINRVGS